MQHRGPYAPFRIPGFRTLVLGGLLTHVGTTAQSLAVGWEVYARTEEPSALGLVSLTQAVPMLVLTLPAGYLANVFDRRKVMILSMEGTTMTSLVLGTMSILDGPTALMYVLLFLDSAFLRLGNPAGTAVFPLIVPHEQFEQSVKWRTTLGHICGVVGPAVGGLLISVSAPAAGAAVMALLMAHGPAIRRSGRTLFLNVAAFGVATIVFGFSRNFWLSWLALFLTGAFDNVSMVIRRGKVNRGKVNRFRAK